MGGRVAGIGSRIDADADGTVGGDPPVLSGPTDRAVVVAIVAEGSTCASVACS
jgi:hypothetical protein